jgi:hypothetical protein
VRSWWSPREPAQMSHLRSFARGRERDPAHPRAAQGAAGRWCAAYREWFHGASALAPLSRTT